MPCNSGVSLTPIVDGQQEWFGARGLYNGLALLGDKTTGSYWDHITGECIYGERKGLQLEFSDFDLIYTTVASALESHPNAQIALSQGVGFRPALQRAFMRRVNTLFPKFIGNRLPPHFLQTLGVEDDRRERMDMGLGVWTTTTARYYPLTMIQAQPTGILDTFAGRSIYVYYNDQAKAPDAFYIDVTHAKVADNGITFDTGAQLRDGKLYAADGQMQTLERSQQMFTRWYGFAYTFPNCEIYESALVAAQSS